MPLVVGSTIVRSRLDAPERGEASVAGTRSHTNVLCSHRDEHQQQDLPHVDGIREMSEEIDETRACSSHSITFSIVGSENRGEQNSAARVSGGLHQR